MEGVVGFSFKGGHILVGVVLRCCRSTLLTVLDLPYPTYPTYPKVLTVALG